MVTWFYFQNNYSVVRQGAPGAGEVRQAHLFSRERCPGNGFNKLSRYAMLWTARHRWPKGARFAFNCYRHYAMVLGKMPRGRAKHPVEQRGGDTGVPPVRNPIWTRTVAVGGVSWMRLRCRTAIKLHGAPAVVRQQPGDDRCK